MLYATVQHTVRCAVQHTQYMMYCTLYGTYMVSSDVRSRPSLVGGETGEQGGVSEGDAVGMVSVGIVLMLAINVGSIRHGTQLGWLERRFATAQPVLWHKILNR